MSLHTLVPNRVFTQERGADTARSVDAAAADEEVGLLTPLSLFVYYEETRETARRCIWGPLSAPSLGRWMVGLYVAHAPR